MLIIKKIEIKNFKIYKEENIDFGENKFIMLTGPNGYGKTSLIDAIEWCITGTIKRLELKHSNRCKKAKEKKRVENSVGILKNKNCDRDEFVSVKLTFICDGEEVTILRERKKDSLEIDEEFEIVGRISNENIKEKIEKIKTENSFYKYNFLDMSKSYRFMETSRVDLKEQVSDFIKDRNNINHLIDNLNEKISEIDIKINNNKENIVKNETEKDKIQKEIENLAEFSDIKEYPNIAAYIGDPLNLKSIEEAKNVDKLIRGWGYNYVYENILNLNKSKNAEKNKKELEEIKNEFIKEENLIIKFIEEKFYEKEKRNKISDKISELEEFKDILNKKFNADASEYDSYEVLKNNFIAKKKEYEQLSNEINLIDQNIRELEKGSKIIEIFSLLVNNKDDIIDEYRNKGNINCPLCGSSEVFAKIKKDDIAKYSSEYLDKYDDILKSNFELKEKKKGALDGIWNSFNVFLDNFIKNEIKKLKENNSRIIGEWKRVKKFFELINKSSLTISKDIIKTIDNEIETKCNGILSKEDAIRIHEKVYEVLKYLQYAELDDIKMKNYSKSIVIIKSLFNDELNYNKFDYNIMVKKLVYLKYYISSKEIEDKSKELNIYEKKINELNNKTEELKDIKETLKKYTDDIGNRLKEIEQTEFEDVGPYLFRIFNKIIKHTNIDGFKFKRDSSRVQGESGISFLDLEENNIMNMFSEGQLGVFMISYFIGNILKRKNENLIESFFMDDITNCLDDINVLSFIDIIKYLINDENNGMNQLFFATCNNNIEALFKNRMEGFNIPYKSIEFDSFGMLNKSNIKN
ncbi:TPA: AAA family ATPase [Clostridium perfringens]|uniref:AAA family ATPase n=1 Tax=Clostridium perfringens TaxID=1502 RepID=UPI000D86CCB5|nr:AAA family ATPase [Clostridium perfringens]EJT6151438.1 AAA family ATPase [Clostridium perfringens]EJT6157122.1 AAA family ATPase [Clostridium perfringens]UBK56492.1 AAA family ATPase [Clostridium perfringens]UBK59053.1 AAA family ATPase [Clostridium perfringens]UBK61623.1 AAA family ATPase [Clostridium perfringens]